MGRSRSVGEILSTLDRLELANNTLVIITSDNGPVIDDGYKDEAVEKLGEHAPAAPFRGGKYSNFEGGTRVPFVLRWPARVKPAVSGALVSQVDLSYPLRAIRTVDYLHIRNFRSDRWPAGDPEQYVAVGPFGDIDGGPSKSLLTERQADPAIAPFFQLATAKRPAEELYDLRKDPHQVRNVAGQAAHRAAQQRLRADLDRWMRDTADPRADADDDR